MPVKRLAAAVWLVMSAALSATAARAQPVYQQIHAFQEIPHYLAGRLVEGPDGVLYGAATVPGPGAILKFSRQPDGTLIPAPLHRFTGTGNPNGGLVFASDGNIYGTTCHRGAAVPGRVFRLTPAGVFTVLYEFLPEFPYETCPTSIVEGADGNLYGTTDCCNANLSSIVFRVTKAGAFTTIAELSPVFGEGFIAPLISAPDGHLYALTGQRLVRVDLSGTVTTVHDFSVTGEITSPSHLIGGVDGNFYGTTFPYDNLPSKVFRITPAGAATVLAAIPAASSGPTAVEQGADGALYVTAHRILGLDAPYGSAFRLWPGSAPSTIHTFTYNEGVSPTDLTRLADGTIVGYTREGGINRRGSLFQINAPSQVRVLTAFSDPTPLHPQGPMVVGPDGALYGTTCDGGSLNAGTVFRLASGSTTPTVLHHFAYWDGACPRGALAVGADGALYGAAAHYGLRLGGTLFRVTTAGAFTPLRFFSGPDGRRPRGGLLRASDGHFYGTTSGVTVFPFFDDSTIFRLSSSGVFTQLHKLYAGRNGYGSLAPLVQGSDGNLYGGSGGIAFRMSLAGTLTTFDMTDDTVLTSPFAEGQDGAMYGVSWSYDGESHAAVFRLSAAGPEPPLTTFEGLDLSGLSRGPDGMFYGASYGDFTTPGMVFQLSPAGALVPLHVFGADDGVRPQATLTLAPDGAMYGSTSEGGLGGGVLFRLVPPSGSSLR